MIGRWACILLLVLLLPSLGAACDITVTSSTTNLNQANRIYCLTTDVTFSSRNLDITANDVTLDGQGFTLTVPDTESNVIYVNDVDRVTIKNIKPQRQSGWGDLEAVGGTFLEVHNIETGAIQLYGTQDAYVHNNEVHGGLTMSDNACCGHGLRNRVDDNNFTAVITGISTSTRFIHITRADNNIFENNYVDVTLTQDTSESKPLQIKEADGNTIRGNYFRMVGPGPDAPHAGNFRSTAANNVVEDNVFTGMWSGWWMSTGSIGPSHDNIFRNNTVDVHKSGVWIHDNSYNNLIEANTIYVTDQGFENDRSSGGTGNRFIGNTVYATNRGVFLDSDLFDLQVENPQGVLFRNNILVSENGFPLHCHEAAWNRYDGDYNLYYDLSGGGYTNCDVTGDDANSVISQDPLFVDGANQDFRLTSGSPAIDQGQNSNCWITPSDGQCDIGAYEYIGGGGGPSCPDGSCNGAETCGTCPQDCGACPGGSFSIPTQSDWVDHGTILDVVPGTWEQRYAGALSPGAIVKKNGQYFLYYIGADGDRSTDGGPRHRAIGVATSPDGISWTKYVGNPVITYLPNNDEEEGVFSLAATLDDNGDVILYFSGLIGTGGSVNGDGILATSTDGFNFNVVGVALAESNPAVQGGDELMPIGVWKDASDVWHMYYIAKGGTPYYDLAYAQSSDMTNFPSSQLVIDQSGNEITGGTGFVQLDGTTFALFLDWDFSVRYTEARTVPMSDATAISSPVEIYNFDSVMTRYTTTYLDRQTGLWIMVYHYYDGVNDWYALKTYQASGGGGSTPTCANGPVSSLCECGGVNVTSGYCCGSTPVAQVACNVDIDCDDSNASTTDTCLNGNTCTASCQYTIPPPDPCAGVTQCTGGDGCCPPGCDGGSDSDCAPFTVMITNVASGAPYTVEYDQLFNGVISYIDRADTFNNVPAYLQGLTFIRTANDDKQSQGSSFLTFDVNRDVTLFVAHDDRYMLKPSWLTSFVDTGDFLNTGGTTPLSIFSKGYSAGSITLGGNTENGVGNHRMYTVVIEPQAPPPSSCGDATCDAGEDALSCPNDCLCTPYSPADLDCNLQVNIFDLTLVGSTFGCDNQSTCWTEKHARADRGTTLGTIDIGDLNIIATNFGNTY